ncbi:MAG TPA: hypothetical protein PKN08_13125, partial [Opitutaceae bacterium]|nr:hypothetical protein [Opitutaceae bacterium]
VERQHIRAFIRLGDWPRLQQTPQEQLPHPSADVLKHCLSHPGVRPLLPAGLRTAIALVPAPESCGFLSTFADAATGSPDEAFWRSTGGPARFVSEPLPPHTLPVLRIAFLGGKTLSPSVLRLEAADGTYVPLGIERFAGDRWQTAHLSVPQNHGPIRLVVNLPAGAPAFAFADPVELGRWSWYAHHVRKHAPLIVWTSIGLLCLGVAGLLCGGPAHASSKR